MSRSGLGGLLALAIALGGCGIARVEGAPVDDLSTWSNVPLPADATLASKALDGSSCTAAAEDKPIQILVQDRRTQWTAAFLFSNATVFGSCFVTSASGGSGGGSGPLPEAMTGRLTIDDNGSGMVADGNARELGGRLADPVVGVVVQLEDGQAIPASVANGYWLAWWPVDAAAARVVGLDASGAEVERLDVPDPGAKP